MRKIPMADLRLLYESIGLKDVITYIQSGNVIFSSNSSPRDIFPKIEEVIQKRFGFDVDVIIRTPDDFQKIIDSNPYKKNIERLYVTFLKTHPSDLLLSKLSMYDFPPEEYSVIDDVIYLYCPNGYGKTKLSNTFFESKLGIRATTRNWKTVNELLTLARSVL